MVKKEGIVYCDMCTKSEIIATDSLDGYRWKEILFHICHANTIDLLFMDVCEKCSLIIYNDFFSKLEEFRLKREAYLDAEVRDKI